MVDHKITGVASVNPNISEKQAQGLPLLPASITMDPAGIDLFQTILQIVFAHMYSPYRLKTEDPKQAEIRENRVAALAFLQTERNHTAHGAPRVTINVDDSLEFVTQYTLAHQHRLQPIVLRIDPRQDLAHCITVQMPTGIFVGLDFGTIKVPAPGKAV
jgi:hypothetical protein